MASSTSARDDAWRSIDIDKYDPDSAVNFNMALFTPALAPISSEDVHTTISQIRGSLRAGHASEALREALEKAPYGADDKSKEAYLALVLDILQAIRQGEVLNTLRDLYSANVELLDVLMKYLYRGMAHLPPSSSSSLSGAPGSHAPLSNAGSSILPAAFTGGRTFHNESGGQVMSVLLSWHEKAVEVAGLGCISRVMTDRRTV